MAYGIVLFASQMTGLSVTWRMFTRVATSSLPPHLLSSNPAPPSHHRVSVRGTRPQVGIQDFDSGKRAEGAHERPRPAHPGHGSGLRVDRVRVRAHQAAQSKNTVATPAADNRKPLLTTSGTTLTYKYFV